ncbi:MAG: tetratricopeptide repeat protein [Longimicrobiaceae bacterium]
MASLEEAGPELAVAFWRVLRKVRAWAETPSEERAGLFAINKKEACERLGAACGLAPGLVEAFGTFSVLVRAPGRVEARQLAEACHQVHEWAEERSLIEVAMLFAEAAAFADPDDPAWANDAGWMSRRAARDDRAASWYHRAYGLSVRNDDRDEVFRALTGYGTLQKDLGQNDEARRYYEKAATRAAYTGRHRRAAVAHHYLLALEAEVGDFSQAHRHANLALNHYPIRDPQLPALAHDWAFLLVRQHHYTPAIPLLRAALVGIQLPEILTVVWGTFARALAGAQQRSCFEEAEKNLLPLIDQHEEYAPAALIHLAEGARAFELWEQAEQYCRRAAEIADRRKDAIVKQDATELLDNIVGRIQPPGEEKPTDPDRIDRIARRLQARLSKWKAPGREQPGACVKVGIGSLMSLMG